MENEDIDRYVKTVIQQMSENVPVEEIKINLREEGVLDSDIHLIFIKARKIIKDKLKRMESDESVSISENKNLSSKNSNRYLILFAIIGIGLALLVVFGRTFFN